MEDKKRTLIWLGILGVVGAGAAVFFLTRPNPNAVPETDSGFYYTGPMRSKGNPDSFGTIDGKSVSAPTEFTKVAPSTSASR